MFYCTFIDGIAYVYLTNVTILLIFPEQMHKLEEQERTRRAAEEALEAENAKYTDQSETKSGRYLVHNIIMLKDQFIIITSK